MAAYTTGANWSFPEDLPGGWVKVDNEEGAEESTQAMPENSKPSPPSPPLGPEPESRGPPPPSAEPEEEEQSQEPPGDQPDEHQHRQRTHYPSRQCRICLETILPTFDTPEPSSLPAAFQSTPRVTYASPQGDGGRLLRPCKCKGSQKYVHEECLTAWRLQNPLEKRNYWQCPTCGYKYNIQRLSYGRWISSTAAQLGLTLLIFVTAMFVLGFVADPIINMYLDPVSTIASMPSAVSEATQTVKSGGRTRSMVFEDEAAGWTEHFVKGLASLGLLGFAKLLVTMTPWQFFNMRGGGFYVGGGGWGGGGLGGGARRGAGVTGRDRLNQISWITILIGIITFLYAVWKGVRAWSRRTLERAGERVMDVPGSKDDDDD